MLTFIYPGDTAKVIASKASNFYFAASLTHIFNDSEYSAKKRERARYRLFIHFGCVCLCVFNLIQSRGEMYNMPARNPSSHEMRQA